MSVPISEAFIDVAAYVAQFRRSAQGQSQTFEQVQARVEALLSASRQAAADYSDADYDEARFAVCAWIDEAMTSVAWRGQADWQNTPLTLKIYEIRDASGQFFERLDRLTPQQDPVREVYYLCLALGYKGRYTSARDQRRLTRRLRSNLRCLTGRRLSIPKPGSSDLFRRSASSTGDRAKKGSALMSVLWLAVPPLAVVGLYILLSRMLACVEQGRLTVPNWFGRLSWIVPTGMLVAAFVVWAGYRLYDVIRTRLFLGQVMANHEALPKATDTSLEPRDPVHTPGIQPRFFGRSILMRHWYLLMGEPGAGKTRAVLSAGLTFRRHALAPGQGFPAPGGVNWWISDQAVILDPAGASPTLNEPGRELSARTEFLTLLERYRQGQRLDGLLVVVAANRLLQARPEALRTEGRRMRESIDALMGPQETVPVTILVSKCDCIHGMTATAELLEDAVLGQAFGAVNPTPLSPGGQAVRTIMPVLYQRLTHLQRIILADIDKEQPDPGVLLFPQEFARLEPGLEVYSQALFPNPSGSHTPILHGIFFASARQEERGPTPFLSALGLRKDRRTDAAADKGLFLHAVFTRVLAEASVRSTPGRGVPLFQRAKRHPRGLAWAVMALVLCVALGIAAYENICTMRDAMAAVAHPVVFKGNLSADLASIQAYQRPLLVLERNNQAWWNTCTGLPGSRDRETRLKQEYCRIFDDAVLGPYDRALEADIANLGMSEPRLGDAMAYLAERINALTARAGREDPAPKKLTPRGVLPTAAMGFADAQRLGELYADYLRWQKDQAAIEKERAELMSVLKLALSKSGDWRWLLSWVNAAPELRAVTLQDFWQGYPQVPDEPRIEPCFTLAGWQRIEGLVTALRTSLGHQDAALLPPADLPDWYSGAYAEAWHGLALAFSQGGTGMEASPRYRALAGKVSTYDGPYFTLLKRLAQDLFPLRGMQPRPDWISLVFEIERIRGAALEAQNPSTDAAVTAFRNYRAALARARASIAPSRSMAFKSASVAFGAQSSASPFIAARNAYQRLNAASAFPNEPFWSLVHAPLDCLFSAACQEAGCHLQGIWEQTVLTPARTTTDPDRLRDLLFRPDGLATVFIQGPAAPFVERNAARGTVARTVLGHTLAFEPAFFVFLTQAGQKVSRPQPEPVKDRELSVEGLPTEANESARLQPHATRLDMLCGGAVKSLLNMNYPVSTRFAWTEDCSAVALNIAVGDIVLQKTYNGSNALERFLRDFPRGTHTFGPADFPRQAVDLKKLGITAITVQYRFIEHRPAGPRAPRSTAVRIAIPARILRCPAPQE